MKRQPLLRTYCHLLVLSETNYQSVMFFVLYSSVVFINTPVILLFCGYHYALTRSQFMKV